MGDGVLRPLEHFAQLSDAGAKIGVRGLQDRLVLLAHRHRALLVAPLERGLLALQGSHAVGLRGLQGTDAPFGLVEGARFLFGIDAD